MSLGRSTVDEATMVKLKATCTFGTLVGLGVCEGVGVFDGVLDWLGVALEVGVALMLGVVDGVAVKLLVLVEL